jgi:hypothetical protein
MVISKISSNNTFIRYFYVHHRMLHEPIASVYLNHTRSVWNANRSCDNDSPRYCGGVSWDCSMRGGGSVYKTTEVSKLWRRANLSEHTWTNTSTFSFFESGNITAHPLLSFCVLSCSYYRAPLIIPLHPFRNNVNSLPRTISIPHWESQYRSPTSQRIVF